ncbi:transposable element Tcb1 transposase [Trichonephila clavipes]|nr:transposable element Tcb1 transposase [Trichonephila clavipes]
MQRPLEANFQQDNAQPYTERVSQESLRNVTTLPWPARSPDWSPIEQIWGHLGLRDWNSMNLNELEARLHQIQSKMS